MARRAKFRVELADGKIPAAEYIRMSTEMQQYSAENQHAGIQRFADEGGYEIVRTYLDEAKSGLQLKGRKALQSLLRDVELDQAPFSAILVYDISRWGRFQDVDESAYYEFLCRRAGFKVIYCAEPFIDGSPTGMLFKSIKRAMAGEYSRELSVKIFAGQARLVEKGFRQGGPPGYGLRRMLTSPTGVQRGIMEDGEQKHLHTDRTVLVPGPKHEVDAVRRMFELCAEGRGPLQVARIINAEGVRTKAGKSWTYPSMRAVLINEKYAGTNVFNRISSRLGVPRTHNPPDRWIRKEQAFEPVISHELFQRAQRALVECARSPSDQVLLDRLRALLRQHGTLSRRVIDSGGGFTAGGYSNRFRSLYNAYALIGYAPSKVDDEVRVRAAVRAVRSGVTCDAAQVFRDAGIGVHVDAQQNLLEFDDGTTLSVHAYRCRTGDRRQPLWHFWVSPTATPDISLIVRMNLGNTSALDFYFFPRMLLPVGRLRLSSTDARIMKQFRFDDLSELPTLLSHFSDLLP